LGELQANKQWVRVEDAQKQAASDRRLPEYQDLRAAASDTLEDQLALAKWCRKAGLFDEARYHWANVLAADPNNADAQRALNVRWIGDRLMTASQIAANKSAQRVRERERLAASIAKWRRALDGLNKVSEDDVLAEIRAIESVEAIPAIEQFIGNPTLSKGKDSKRSANEMRELRNELTVAFVYALAGMPQPAATEELTRLAVFSFPGVRAEAAEELKKRPRYDYVPLLLSGLNLPVQVPSRVEPQSNGTVRYATGSGSLCSGGLCAMMSAFQSGAGGSSGPGSQAFASVTAKLQESVERTQAAIRNRDIATTNELIVDVLKTTTGQNLGNDPKEWWKWWQSENDYYAMPKQAVYQDSHRTEEKLRQPTFLHSCFAKGTPVWTKTGRTRIQALRAGDLVLSQNVDTGELRYEPVVARSERPPTALIKVSVDGDTFQATKGNPFWVAGTGWQMAKELGKDGLLCGLHRASTIRSIEPAKEAETISLTVGEFNTYFIGEKGTLVHDDTPRRPTQAKVPGFNDASK